MKKLSNVKSLYKSVIIILAVLFSFPLLSFKDNGEYKIIDGKVIKRGFGQYYEVGMVNVKFKASVNIPVYNKFWINNLDSYLAEYNINQLIQRHPLNKYQEKRKIGDEDLSKIYAIKFEKAVDPLDFAEQLKNRFPDLLDWAEPSFLYEMDYVPNDPLAGSQWHLVKINAFQAWDINRGDTNVIVGIVDSGTDFDHPDLQANFKTRWSDPVNGIDDDANGFVDDFHGWDFWANDNDPGIAPNGNVHGSHVSGCASQVTDNGVHGAGIGFKVKLMVTKHTDDTNPESLLYNTDQGLVYCYQNGAKVINCSFGSSSFSAYSQTVVNNAWANGTIICASAGNGDANGVGQNWARYPASYDNVVSVAATGTSDVKTSFSNYHTTVDICAPGDGILSTVYNNSYTGMSGTSMSSPITAGVVGLIRSKYSSLTPQQVVDRLKLGVDSIYNLNPTYVGLLGTGRVNAFKCLSDYPIVKIVSTIHNDSLYGNNDKVYDIGEVIPVAITFRNTFIAGSNASLRLITADPDVEIVQDSVYIGNIPAYNNFSTSITNTFRVKAKSTCAYDKTVTFTVASASTCYTDNNANTFTIKFRQGFAIQTVNNLKLALMNDGAIGKKAQSYGPGLTLYNEIINQIYESGLMIGISNTKVSDVSRRGTTPANTSDTDFVPLKSYTFIKPGILSAQDGNGKFNDNGAGLNKIGVEVTSESFAFNSVNDSNYILLRFNIKNTNATAINNLYAGIFTFFSPAGNFASDNITRYDAPNKLGYTYYTASPYPYLGVASMTNQPVNFKAILIGDLFDGFTTEEKWLSLSSGIANDSLGPDGTAFTIAAGPLNIQPNQTVVVGFALIKGNNLMDLKNISSIARNKYNSVGIKQISELMPKKYELMQNYPNPFNPTTTINFAIPVNEFVNIKIYDVLGREVKTLVNEKLNAGYYEFSFDGSNLSSGLYFYRMTTNKYSDIKRMIMIK